MKSYTKSLAGTFTALFACDLFRLGSVSPLWLVEVVTNTLMWKLRYGYVVDLLVFIVVSWSDQMQRLFYLIAWCNFVLFI